MRQFLLFILPVLAIVIVAFVVFAVIQTRVHDERAGQELERRVKAIAESTELTAAQVFETGNLQVARRLTLSFEKRQRFQGYVLYDLGGRIVAATPRVESIRFSRDYLHDVIYSRSAFEHYETFEGVRLYCYAMPVLDDEGRVLGIGELLYEANKPQELQTAFWKRLSTFLIALSITLILLTTQLQRKIFMQPVKKITKWFHGYLSGETGALDPSISSGHLREFAVEVEQLALDLKVAKRSLSVSASRQLNADEMWTEEKLRSLVHAKLGESSLIVASNREPLMHKYDKAAMSTKVIVPAGGVVTALQPILEACGGTWVAHGSGDQDKQFVNSKDKLGVPPEDIRYILKRVWLKKEEEEGYYYGFSNEGLWPLCHNTHTRPIFRQSDWEMYKAVNRKFADSILAELPAKNPYVFIQDYHFTLLARYIKEKRPDAAIGLFWHIPWPTAEAFSICPYHAEILDGLLACDLIGFHLQSHCNNFLESANRLLESRINLDEHSVVRNGIETFVKPFPISIDSTDIEDKEDDYSRTLETVEKLKKDLNLKDKIVGVGVDRLDYTKGIIERFLAIERFLENSPEMIGKFVFIQIGSPSRTHIKSYHEFSSEVDQTVERINWKFNDGGWSPIIYLKKHFDAKDIVPFYTLADLCIVSSLHDGMNLVAKEYVAAKKDNNGVLILSKYAGASRELLEAIIINPYSIEEFASAIKLAFEIPFKERQQRMQAMRRQVKENNVFKWAGSIVSDLMAISNRKIQATVASSLSS